MLGSIIGDIIGSRFEFMATQELIENDKDFFHPACCFTDDTVCLAAITKSSLSVQSVKTRPSGRGCKDWCFRTKSITNKTLN